jgi:hypothetical protein
MDINELAELKFGSIRALESYIAELQRTKESFDRILEPSPELTSIIDEQQRAERHALANYERIKQHLLRALSSR